MSEPYLSEEQQIALFHAVGRRLASLVTRTPGKNIAEQVPDIAGIPLLGAFVSLKKDGELRSCMGTMSDAMPLGTAVDQAAVHAAKDDPRFPPITSAELFELDMEIWLLWGMERVKERGQDRINAVEIGTHGVQISRGGNRGLLLPGVAIEYSMDARTFLESVCRKAGLPSDAWLDDRSLLHRFEGRAVSGPVSATEDISKKTADEMIFAAKFNRGATESPLNITPSDISEIRRVCMEAFQGMADGVSPANYYPGLYDGNVSGITLSFQLPERPLLGVSKISVRPDVPFQETLIQLLQILGQEVEKLGATSNEVYDAVIDVSIFHDPAIHGNANRHDLSTADTAYRSVMVSSPQGWVLQYAPEKDAESVVKESVKYMELADLDLGEVISFETVTTTPQVFLSSVSKPERKDEVRPAGVAGAFYPSDVKEMNDELDRMLRSSQRSSVQHSSIKPSCNAVLVPHAAWLYSGSLAAQVLSSVAIPKRVIIFSPQHRHSGGMDWAVAPNRIWQLPGRSVETDIPFAEEMTNAVKYFSFDARPHIQEHSIEVQLPILARLAPQTKIAAVAMMRTSWQMIQAGALQLATFLETLDELPLLMISSDMNHFANEETTRRTDRSALNAVKKAVVDRKPEYALNFVNENQISMCGIYPAVFVMETLRCLGRLDTVKEVGYTTSAESGGDTQRVVGYAGLIF
ncbi:MAG: AmmeMemoRadiSam system protein B [Planctomycetaceae bacterium]|jgi:AmmeMemoRadiSam system protein B/AmmeMemoRadiSam system protein A|nr:AmmeMemoRadiSam system protein B [Planctomycetaceae bacterium]